MTQYHAKFSRRSSANKSICNPFYVKSFSRPSLPQEMKHFFAWGCGSLSDEKLAFRAFPFLIDRFFFGLKS